MQPKANTGRCCQVPAKRLYGSRNHTLKEHECSLQKFEPYELRIVLSSYGSTVFQLHISRTKTEVSLLPVQCQGFRKHHFIEWCCRRSGSTGLCAEPAGRVTLPHHVPQQQHCLGLVCSMAAPSARSDACLRGLACGGQLSLRGCTKLPLLTIYPLPRGRQTEQKRSLGLLRHLGSCLSYQCS